MVMGVFNIKQHHARALLIHYRWNTFRLNDHLERKGQDRMLMEAGVVLSRENNKMAAPSPPPASTTKKQPSRKKTKKKKEASCNVCFEDFSPHSMSAMDCGHSFCDACWTGYFVSAIGGGNKQVRCMEFKCPAIVDEEVVQHFLGRKDPAMAERFQDLLLQSYVDDNSAVKWCPSVPHCGRAIRVASGELEVEPLCEAECPCGVSFCFRCAAATTHSPCPCAMWERWDAKGRGEAENTRWILANTISCPKCFKPIVKDGHSCNRFKEEEKKKVDDAKRQLRRYEHYYKRFESHRLSCTVEREKIGPAVARRVEELESHDSILIKDASWLSGAHRSLLACRRALAQSYVFAYYMFDAEETATVPPPEKGSLSMAQRQSLFEDYQEQVEGNVEKLSELLGKDVIDMPDEDIVKVRQNAVNLVRVVETHCRKMYGCIQDELLPMLVEPMSIASFQPGGPSKAAELPA
nr:unnamed protein product [Digitaria exilis]